MPRRGYDGHEYAALLTAVAMPLHDVARLDRSRVEHWKTRASSGWTPTAVALSVLDGQMPATSGWRGPPAEDEQFLLTHVVLDGHHRLQAAAELGVPARILSFWSEEFSLVKTADALPVIERLCAPAKA
jgi:hypothetical protein